MFSIQAYFQWNAKAIVVLCMSVVCIYLVLNRFQVDAKDILQLAFTVGIFHQITLYLFAFYLRKYTDLRKWHTYFRPNRRYSAGQLFFHLLQFLFLIYILPQNAWNVATTALLLCAFLAGIVTGQLLMALLLPATKEELKPIERRTQLDGERYEAFIATIISTIILGSSFLQVNDQPIALALNGFILLPIIYALINLFFTYFFLSAMQNHFRFMNRYMFIFSIVSIIIHYFIIDYLVNALIPEVFLVKGIEYNKAQINLVMQSGLFWGFLAGLFVIIYHQLAKVHLKKILNKKKQNKAWNLLVRVLLNGVVYLMPVACLVAAFIKSIQLLGLFGLTLTFLSMLSNIGLKLFIQYDRLDFKSASSSFTTEERQLLQVYSPTLRVILLSFLKIKKSTI